MSYHWNITHARWVPTIPQVGTAMAVFTTPLIGSSGIMVAPDWHCWELITKLYGSAACNYGRGHTTTSDDTVEMADNMSPPCHIPDFRTQHPDYNYDFT